MIERDRLLGFLLMRLLVSLLAFRFAVGVDFSMRLSSSSASSSEDDSLKWAR